MGVPKAENDGRSPEPRRDHSIQPAQAHTSFVLNEDTAWRFIGGARCWVASTGLDMLNAWAVKELFCTPIVKGECSAFLFLRAPPIVNRRPPAG